MPKTSNPNCFFDSNVQRSLIPENNVDAMVKKYQAQKIPLIGVYNIQSEAMTLFPCFRNRLILVANKDVKTNGVLDIQYTAKIINKKRVDLSNEEKNELNSQIEGGKVFPARFIFNPERNQFISPHQYMLNLMQVPQHEIKNYRGFACEPSNKDQYSLVFKSGSLNSPKDENGTIIKRVRGAEPTLTIKDKIQEKFTQLTLKCDMDREPRFNSTVASVP